MDSLGIWEAVERLFKSGNDSVVINVDGISKKFDVFMLTFLIFIPFPILR